MHSRRPQTLRKAGFGSFGAAGDEGGLGGADERGVKKIIAASKSSGTLNLSNRQLQEVPQDVFQLPENDDSVKWWEAVDLTKLDLSHNLITQLPLQLWDLSALVTLLASHNKLQQLSPGINALQCLRMLDLSDNPGLGPTLLDEVAALPSLATLNANNCGLEALPDTLGGPQQPKLSALSVAGNALRGLPSGLACAGSLVVLNASNNQLDGKLPGRLVRGWSALKELDLSHNQLRELPAELGSLPALAQLDARHNQLTALPPALGDAGALNELRVGFNQLASLPGTLGMLRSLRTLDCRNNLITEIPDAVCGLQLVLLDFTNNSLRRLPAALGHMTTLRSLPLDGNPLKLMRRELWAGPLSALLQHLRDQEQHSAAEQVSASTSTAVETSAGGRLGALEGAVALRGSGLSSVPPEVWEAGGAVASLDVSDNNLSASAAHLAAGLAQLTALKALTMNNCALATLPLVGLGPRGLPGLQTLELCGNSFGRCCPADGLAACPRLRSLDLSGVRGLQLPAGLFDSTPELEVLVACRAGLSEFPTAVLAAGGLTRLSLGSNSLSSIPVEVTQLTRLQELDVSHNQLTGLPPQMGLMGPTLRVLLLEGNCIRVIRRPVLEKGTASVLEWLKDRIPA